MYTQFDHLNKSSDFNNTTVNTGDHQTKHRNKTTNIQHEMTSPGTRGKKFAKSLNYHQVNDNLANNSNSSKNYSNSSKNYSNSSKNQSGTRKSANNKCSQMNSGENNISTNKKKDNDIQQRNDDALGKRSSKGQRLASSMQLSNSVPCSSGVNHTVPCIGGANHSAPKNSIEETIEQCVRKYSREYLHHDHIKSGHYSQIKCKNFNDNSIKNGMINSDHNSISMNKSYASPNICSPTTRSSVQKARAQLQQKTSTINQRIKNNSEIVNKEKSDNELNNRSSKRRKSANKTGFIKQKKKVKSDNSVTTTTTKANEDKINESKNNNKGNT